MPFSGLDTGTEEASGTTTQERQREENTSERIPAIRQPENVAKDAYVSPCQKYRWWLTRIWDPALATLAFVMLNPSTADAQADDPTTRRCIAFARRDGFGGICIFNLWGLRATSPVDLKKRLAATTMDGKDDSLTEFLLADYWLRYAAGRFTHVVCAWGNVPGTLRHQGVQRAACLCRGLTGGAGDLLCLGCTGSGQPRHPLYVRNEQPLLPYCVP
ncbi:DUF1643-domain-containing protein [Cryphonectria parasitica EP155]|uniref:DUF1643-domain-containing protein n=1 Tax=Cryphonectria parasitica (strain ATCC 38755 / EP155) TaxID=660469 RepID=A0A9P4Y3W4_CRYP1|nr:DUF1643-domain-containing protein [Cryphonectria parasitica EP155]KAF3766156.1 DUF1643-domain-containing protein [Cryphonectria parasitica EP155]